MRPIRFRHSFAQRCHHAGVQPRPPRTDDLERSALIARPTSTTWILVIYLAATLAFASVTSEPAHLDWALLAAPGYLIALLASLVRRWSKWAAASAALLTVAVPTVVLVLAAVGQPEVNVIGEAADTWWRTGTPYLHD